MPFHVFLSHSSTDKPAVEELARRLAKEGIQAWLDKWHLIPGKPWQPDIEKALAGSETCAVFVGPSGFGPWQNEEMRAAIDQRVRDSDRHFRVIPVLLPGAKRAERSSLPTFLATTTWVEFSDSLNDPAAFHRLVCGIRGLEPGVGPGQALYEGQCPYRGLRVFDVDDAPFFFGREALVQWLLNELRLAVEGQQVNRFLAIMGSSGSGKSSVARAGLVAAIRRDDIPASSRWPVAICRPGSDPLESLAVALSSAMNVGQGAPALAELIAEFQKNEKTLHLISRQSLPENGPAKRLVVVVDQFEEVFTLCRKDKLREGLIRNLLYAAKVTQGQTLVILTMRADFYAKCAANAELAAAFSDHHVLVGPMTEDELRRAVERPAQLVGCELEAGLVDLLVQDVRHQPGALPLLQHALLELWHKRVGRRLTIKAYQEIGKLEGALQRRADATLKAFSPDEQELCRRTFLRLTQPGEGTEDTKRRASMQELLSLSGKSAAEEKIIQKLADASLLTTEGELSHEGAFVEVAHEALIRNWSQLRKWINEDRAGLRTRTRLTEAAREWKNSGCDTTYLYIGARLAVAKEWACAHSGELSAEEAEFLGCSLEAQQEREASEFEVVQRLARAEAERAEAEKQTAEQKERLAVMAQQRAEDQKRIAEAGRELIRRRYVITTLLLVTALLGSFSYFAYRQTNTEKALRQVETGLEQVKKRSDQLLELAQRRLNQQDDPKKDVVALHYLSRALNAYPRNAKAAELTRDLLCGKIWCPPLTRALRSESESPLLNATFGPEGQVFAVSSDGNFLSWNGEGSSLVRRQALLPEESPSTGDNFVPNKANLAAACFSHDGERLLVISPQAPSGTTARAQVWSWSPESTSYERKCPSIVITDPFQYYNIVWSNDGNLLVVISRRDHPSYQVFQYDGRGYHDLQSPFGPGKVAAATFSPDDKLLVTVSPEGAVSLWDAATLKPATGTAEVKGSFNLSRDRTTSLAFVPDKSVLVMTSFSQPIQFLDIRTGELKQVSSQRTQDQAMRLVFTPQQAGKRLAAKTLNRRVEIAEASALDRPVAEPICFTGVVGSSRFSPDGKKILILSGPYWMAFDTVRVWDTDLQNPMLERTQIPFDGSLAPLWLADLAEAISGIGLDELSPATLEEIRKKYPADAARGTYDVIWRRFFPE